jgi:predicted nicotinamide N-methyase
VDVRGTTYTVTHPLSADALIDEQEFARDERLPYWANLWPSAVALSRHLAARDLSETEVVELGCGVGLPSTVALARGASVLATDHYEAALAFARHNARANTGRELRTATLDWHAPRPEGLGTFDLVVAADVLYEQRNVAALASLVSDLLSPGGELVLADPRRANAPAFLEAMGSHGLPVLSEEEAQVEGPGRAVKVLLYTLRRGG